MESIKKFNALDGKRVTRKELSELKAAALKEGSNDVSKRIGRILDRYPDIDAFNVSIKNPIRQVLGLGTPRHKGIIKDALDDSGRLKPGFRYLKGGKIERIDKIAKHVPKVALRKRRKNRRSIAAKKTGLGFPDIPVSEIIHPVVDTIPAEKIHVIQEQIVADIPDRNKRISPVSLVKENAKPVIPPPSVRSKNPLVKSMAERSGSGEFFEFTGSLGSFIGRLEKKPKESVVITLDAPQGAGKTRLFFQIMNLCASHGMKVLYLSFEEHPDSELFTSKRDQYIDPENHDRIDTIAELPSGYADFKSLVPEYDAIFTDSFGKKETKCGGKFDLDNDQRKAFDGKVFFDIYQRTQDNKMRGGSLAQFDADAVMKIEKDPTGNYENNIAYFDKHRYHTQPLNLLRYNIFSQEMEGGTAAGNAEITEII